jgi:hypothetical protein
MHRVLLEPDESWRRPSTEISMQGLRLTTAQAASIATTDYRIAISPATPTILASSDAGAVSPHRCRSLEELPLTSPEGAPQLRGHVVLGWE